MRGNLESGSAVQIKGTVDGDVQATSVVVGEKGAVTGNVVTDTINVQGFVRGNIEARVVELEATAHVIGDTTHQDLRVRSKKGPPWRCKKGPLGGCGLVPVVHGRAPRATRRALNRPTRRRAREGPVGPRGQAWVGWSVQFAVGV